MQSKLKKNQCKCRSLCSQQRHGRRQQSAAFITLEDIDFKSAFEKLCPGDAFSFAGFLFFA